MKNNLFIKVICLLIAALMIMPALPDNQAYAASIASNNFATINSQNNTALLLGSYYMKVQVFVDGSPVYESESLRFGSRGPGTVTVNANPGYELINLYRSDPGVTTGGSVFTNGSNFVISSGSNNSRTLRIYLESVPPETIIDNEYVSVESQTDTVTGGNTYMRVQIFVDGGSTAVYDSGSSTSSMFRFGSSGPGTITVTEKSGYGITDLYRSNQNSTSGNNVFSNGTAFVISTGTGSYRTLKIYLNSKPQNIVDNDYVSIVTQNTTTNIGANNVSAYMRVQVFVEGISSAVYDSGSSSSSMFRFGGSGPGTVSINEKSGYEITNIYRSNQNSTSGNNAFNNGTNFEIGTGTGSYRTLRIYLRSIPQTIVDNEYVSVEAQYNTATGGNTYMQVQVYVDNGMVYDSGSSSRFRFGSNGPGTITVTEKSGYGLSDLYRSSSGSTSGGSQFTNGTVFSISSGSGRYRTLRIYLNSKPQTIIDNDYVNIITQNAATISGNNDDSAYMRVQVFVEGISSAVYDSGSSSSSMFRFGSSGPGTVSINEKSGYEISNIYRSNSGSTSGNNVFNNGTNFEIGTGTGSYRTLRIYLRSIPQTILDNEYVSVVSQNNTNSSGNYYMRVQIFVDNTNVYDTGGSSGRFRFSNGPGTITVTEKSGYGLSGLYRSNQNSTTGGSSFTNGTTFAISTGTNGYRTLRIYLNSAPQTIVDNDYVNIITQNAATISGNNDDSAYMRVQVFVEGVGSAVYDSGSSSSSMFRFGESGPGTVSINEKSGYEITNIYRSNPNSTSGNNVFNNGTNFQIGAGTGSYRTLRIYLRSIPQTILDNEYVSVVSQNNTNSSGNYYMRVQIFVDNTNVYDTGSSGRFRFSNGPGTITVTEKSGYELLNLYRSSSGSTSGGSLFTNGANFDIGSGSSSYRTLRIYLTSLPQTIVDNEYVTVVSRNRTTDSGSDDSSKFMRVQVYLDDENIPVYDSGSSSSSMFRYGGSGPGAVTVTENSGYRILYLRRSNENTTNGNNAFNNGSDFSISTRPNRYRTLKIYLESLAPKALKINYFYDNVLQPEESTTSIIPIGEQVNLELKNIEGKVFQKARISDDNIERSIDVETKEISFTMPNKEVTLDYYYGTEGQVLLKKTAEQIPGKTNEFYIDLSVEGTPIVTRKAADIVLVFDKSGSMAWGVGGQYSSGPSRMSILKEAANIFINRVIPANEISLNQVSIVTYSGNKNDGAWNDAEILQPFTSINTIAKNSYADLDAVGGTNSQAGFVTAQEAFDESNGARQGVERYVIYMTDGAAGYYYNSSNGNTEGTDSPSESNPNSTAVSRAISSAIDLKNATNAKIYTVAFISNDSGAVQVLNPKDSRGNNRYQEGYYKATSATELTGIYNLLAEKISEEIANNAVITDTLPSDFTFDTTSLPADVTIDTNGKLTWNLGTVNTDEEKIRVAVKYSGDKYGISFTNESCGIEYVHKNTPDEVTTKTFEVPLGVLSPVIELPTQSVPFGYSLVIDPIPSAYDSNKLNAGEDKGYRVSDLSVSIYKHPDHGTVVLNDDGTFLYTPDEGYEGDDSFQYKVIMEITNDYGIDPDGLVGDYVTITTVYINVEKRPTYTLTIHYVQEGIGEMLDLRYSAELAPGQSYSVTSPEVTGWTAQSKTVTGTMPMGDVHVWVTYTRNESKLLQHRMYPNKGLNYELMGAAKEDYKIVSGIDYTFGFEFVAGEDNPNFSLSRSNTVNNTLDTFKLYDESGNLLDSRNTLEGLNGTLIEQGKTYTITYRLRFENNVSGSTSLEVDFEYMDDIPSGVYKELNITSTPMYQLQ